jgi:uncharacterized protein YggE
VRADWLKCHVKLMAAATGSAIAGLAVVGVLGVAAAEAPTSTTTTPTTTTTTVATPVRTVTVQGVANEAIEPAASAATATSVYRQGMTDAITDGQSKAQFLAGKAGASVGAVQSIVEDGGYISCSGEIEYSGEQPDWGSSGGGPVAPISAHSVARAPQAVSHKPAGKHRKSNKRPKAKSAAAGGCTLSAQITLVYALN